MSPSPSEKLTLPRLAEMTGRGERIVMVTAYDAPSARLADEAGIDLILVGDSAAMVVLGRDSTLPVTLDEMLMLTSAVSRVTRRALVVGDLPFGSYQESDEKAVASAVRMVKEGGADIVKLEGADRRLSRVRAIGDAGIPVMSHIGLTPQSATLLGDTGRRDAPPAPRIACTMRRSRQRPPAAARWCWRQCLPKVASAIARALTIPVIGIGAGPDCDEAGAGVARPARRVARSCPALRQKRYAGSRVGDPPRARCMRERKSAKDLPRTAPHLPRCPTRARAVRGDGERAVATRLAPGSSRSSCTPRPLLRA